MLPESALIAIKFLVEQLLSSLYKKFILPEINQKGLKNKLIKAVEISLTEAIKPLPDSDYILENFDFNSFLSSLLVIDELEKIFKPGEKPNIDVLNQVWKNRSGI